MEYTAEERGKHIIAACLKETSKNPYLIFKNIAVNDFVRIHGPEHHVLDGACVLTAFYNAGGKIDLKEALAKVLCEGLRMPGAMCGLWGVCGAVSSIGAALSIIDGTGPLTSDGSWGSHMMFTSKTLERLGRINGPRCCKRDAFMSMITAVDYINKNYDVTLEKPSIKCDFSSLNKQCIGARCPFNRAFLGQTQC